MQTFVDCSVASVVADQSKPIGDQKPPAYIQRLPSGAEVWRGSTALFLAGHSSNSSKGMTYVARNNPLPMTRRNRICGL